MTMPLDRHPWLLVVLAFVILLTAWTSLIVVAVKHQPEKVPLEHVSQSAGTTSP